MARGRGIQSRREGWAREVVWRRVDCEWTGAKADDWTREKIRVPVAKAATGGESLGKEVRVLVLLLLPDPLHPLPEAVLTCPPGTHTPAGTAPPRRASPRPPRSAPRPARAASFASPAPRGDHNMAAAPGLLLWLLLLRPLWRVPGQPDPDTVRRFSQHKLCADDECSSECPGGRRGGGGSAAHQAGRGAAGRAGGAPRWASPGSLRLSPPALPAPAAPAVGVAAPPTCCQLFIFPSPTEAGVGGGSGVAPGFTASPPPARPGSEEGWGGAPLSLGSPRCPRALSCSLGGDLAGCSTGADALRARWAPSLRQVAGGARERLPGAAPLPLCFTGIRGSDHLLNRDWSLGLGRARSPGLRCVPRSPPRLCLSSVISVLGRLLQTARQGGHRKGQNLSFSKEATWDQQPPLCAGSGMIP